MEINEAKLMAQQAVRAVKCLYQTGDLNKVSDAELKALADMLTNEVTYRKIKS